jgi:hypothetical protein
VLRQLQQAGGADGLTPGEQRVAEAEHHAGCVDVEGLMRSAPCLELKHAWLS